jgi:hypothetical protein
MTMRIARIALLVAGVAVLLYAPPARAQASAPVCLHVYGPVTYDECTYASIDQCKVSASGRPAACLINPYYAADKPPPRRKVRRID